MKLGIYYFKVYLERY